MMARRTPTPPIAIADTATARVSVASIDVDDATIERLAATGARVTTSEADRIEASRDWWPLAMTWAAHAQVTARAAAVVRIDDVDQVAAVLAIANEAGIPVTAAAGRSGVTGGSVPLFGGIVLDLSALQGIVGVDATDGVVDVLAGTFGDAFEEELQSTHGLTVGHWPQSMALSTIGGWLACRGAGQLSNRYGKIEDIVIGLDVVLADGRRLTTGGQARQSAGPDLTQLFVGSEGTLGIITGARLRAWPVPTAHHRSAWGFTDFATGARACRAMVQRGLSAAALRLYDPAEADRSYSTGPLAVLLAFDEGDAARVDAVARITTEECTALGAQRLDDALVDRWFEHRNDVSALEALISRGYMVDTMELTVPWSRLDALYDDVCAAIAAVPGVLAATAHLSHSYSDGACLYFTFAASPIADDSDGTALDARYRAVWDAGTRVALAHGGSLSHHHGIGLNRGRFLRQAIGTGAHDVLIAVKAALDPRGILNPGKLGIPTHFGEVPEQFR